MMKKCATGSIINLIVLCFGMMTLPTTLSRNFNIGFIVTENNMVGRIQKSIHKLNKNFNGTIALNSMTSLGDLNNLSHLIVSNEKQQMSADRICGLLSNKVHLFISSANSHRGELSEMLLTVADLYKIPLLLLHDRDSQLSDKSKYPVVLRTVPPFSAQAQAFADVIIYFKWNKVNVIVSDDIDGHMTFVKFSTIAYKNNILIEETIFLTNGTDDKISLRKLNKSTTKVNLIACNSLDALTLFKILADLNLTREGFVWMANEQAVNDENILLAPQGLLYLHLQTEYSDQHLHHAVSLAAEAFRSFPCGETDKPPSSCDVIEDPWRCGEILYEKLLQTEEVKREAETLKFDWYGDPRHSAYHIMNVHVSNASKTNSSQRVGVLKDGVVELNEEEIVWPGNKTKLNDKLFSTSQLRVATIESFPFVYVVEIPSTGNCSDLDYVDSDGYPHTHLKCEGPSSRFKGRQHCCKGYCMDLLKELSGRMNFSFSLRLVEDGKYGSLNKVNGSHERCWNGMVGEVIHGKADLIMASLTINSERSNYIDYSKPYRYHGLTILIRKEVKTSSLASFLLPFEPKLWILVVVSVFVIALVLYLLDRFSPFGSKRLTQSNKEETAINLSNAIWFSWGVLLNSGIGEATPRSFSARVLGMVWACFAMIIIASYTANLAAFLVLDRPHSVIRGIDDPLMRNPTPEFPFGTVDNSSVEAYFRRQVELSSTFTFMESYNVQTEHIGMQMVRNGSLKAFIWDSPVLKHATINSQTLTTVGETFGRAGYGIGMTKGSKLKDNISLIILQLHENGRLEELHSQWVDRDTGVGGNGDTITLGLEHMLGVFIMVGVGIGAGIIIVVIEAFYYRHKGWRKDGRKMVAKSATLWQEKVHSSKQKVRNELEDRVSKVCNGREELRNGVVENIEEDDSELRIRENRQDKDERRSKTGGDVWQRETSGCENGTFVKD